MGSGKFDLHENEWFRTKTRFDTEEKGNLEMAIEVLHGKNNESITH